MIVVDVGCYPHDINGTIHSSIPALVERFSPRMLYGFDPWPDMHDYEARVEGTRVIARQRAAWIDEGTIEFAPHDLGATVMQDKDTQGEWRHHYNVRVPCFDFARWLVVLPEEETVVKLDCEGAEFPILERLIEFKLDDRIALLLVEWHDHVMAGDFSRRREEIVAALRCPMEDW